MRNESCKKQTVIPTKFKGISKRQNVLRKARITDKRCDTKVINNNLRNSAKCTFPFPGLFLQESNLPLHLHLLGGSGMPLVEPVHQLVGKVPSSNPFLLFFGYGKREGEKRERR